MAKYKVAIIGSTGRGDYGHGLDAVWQRFDDCEVVAVADPVEAGLVKALARTGAARGYADYREMLDKEHPQIVAVCPRWIDQHRDMAIACAEHGCHMYMEKPFARTLGEADEIIRACEMRHLKLAVAHISRYSPQLGLVKKLIASGEIGDILEIRARGKEDARGGGEDLWVLGTHVLDLMRVYGGDPVSCYATMRQSGLPVRPEHVRAGNEGLGPLAGDRIDAMYRFQSGVVGYFSSQRGAGGNPNRFGLRIYGSRGVIDHTSGYGNPAYLIADPHWSGPTSRAAWRTISSQGIDQPETLTATGYEGGNPAAARDLIAAIEQDRPPLCSMTEARGAIEMVLGVFESHRVGGPVSLPLTVAGHPLEGGKSRGL
ncbi:MAG: gfo/Idh/MocA family oxidoreductase [Planctomycetota bacterium]|nr:MAG: gfo/Idh/MocA family oxidoreductase [Planctomycetota bacterium]